MLVILVSVLCRCAFCVRCYVGVCVLYAIRHNYPIHATSITEPNTDHLTIMPSELRSSAEFSHGRTSAQYQGGWINTVQMTSTMSSAASKRSSVTRKSGEVGIKYQRQYMRRRNLILSLVVRSGNMFYVIVYAFLGNLCIPHIHCFVFLKVKLISCIKVYIF